ncbi:MAG: hypothetical protein IKF17_01240 [Clostridia bacterium]|nr:hypothetical protein [Clostridia bacterium]
MKFRGNKGITGIDISVSLIIFVLFVSLITTLVYNFAVASRNVNRKAVATDIAIKKIEELKQTPYDQILEIDEENPQATQYADKDGVILASGSGPYKIITDIEKYTNDDIENIQDVLKIVKVRVVYNAQNREESIEISTVITRED